MAVFNQGDRDLLIDHISRRSVEVDCSTLQALVANLVRLFWKVIEDFNPDQDDLRLSPEAVAHWKESLLVCPNGKPRHHLDGPFMQVRAFLPGPAHQGLHTWAVAEPERWAQWVAPCPIRDEDLRWFHVRRRRLQERTANRTRERQPLLPILSRHVTDQWQRQRTLLEAARAVPLGEHFTVDGTEWQRVSAKMDAQRLDPTTAPIRAVNRSTGTLVQLTNAENRAFWQWAIVETLRLAGLRAEELTELTHLSVRNYQRSQWRSRRPARDHPLRERPRAGDPDVRGVVPRHRPDHPPPHQHARHRSGLHPLRPARKGLARVAALPVPERPRRRRRAMSTPTMWRMISQAAEGLVDTDPRFAEVKFAAYDFRRLVSAY